MIHQTAFRSNDYGYTRLYFHNESHLEVQHVSDDKVNKVNTEAKSKSRSAQ